MTLANAPANALLWRGMFKCSQFDNNLVFCETDSYLETSLKTQWIIIAIYALKAPANTPVSTSANAALVAWNIQLFPFRWQVLGQFDLLWNRQLQKQASQWHSKVLTTIRIRQSNNLIDAQQVKGRIGINADGILYCCDSTCLNSRTKNELNKNYSTFCIASPNCDLAINCTH